MGEFKVLCLDKASFIFCTDHRIPCELTERKVSSKFCLWGDSEYKKIVFYKLDLKRYFIEKYGSKFDFVTYIDTDIWILKNFRFSLDLVTSKNSFDILFQDGEPNHEGETSTLADNGLIKMLRPCNNFCSGFMVMKMESADRITKFLSYSFVDRLRFSGNQRFLNKRIKNSWPICPLSLPKEIAINLSSAVPEISNKSWFVHYNWLVGNLKIDTMKKNGHWLL